MKKSIILLSLFLVNFNTVFSQNPEEAPLFDTIYNLPKIIKPMFKSGEDSLIQYFVDYFKIANLITDSMYSRSFSMDVYINQLGRIVSYKPDIYFDAEPKLKNNLGKLIKKIDQWTPAYEDESPFQPLIEYQLNFLVLLNINYLELIISGDNILFISKKFYYSTPT